MGAAYSVSCLRRRAASISDRREYRRKQGKTGKSALAGPIVNIVLAVIFLVFYLFSLHFAILHEQHRRNRVAISIWVGITCNTGIIGMEINAWLRSLIYSLG